MHYYLYTLRAGRYFYERTTGTRESAEWWANELKRRGHDAVWLVDHLIKGAYY